MANLYVKKNCFQRIRLRPRDFYRIVFDEGETRASYYA